MPLCWALGPQLPLLVRSLRDQSPWEDRAVHVGESCGHGDNSGSLPSSLMEMLGSCTPGLRKGRWPPLSREEGDDTGAMIRTEMVPDLMGYTHHHPECGSASFSALILVHTDL